MGEGGGLREAVDEFVYIGDSMLDKYLHSRYNHLHTSRVGALMPRPPILKCRQDLTITVEKRQSEKIKRYAARVRKSVSQIIREFIEELDDESLKRPEG
jgi:hypothetical protein